MNKNTKIRILIDAHVFGGEHQGSLTYLKGLYNALLVKYPESYELFFAGSDLEAMRAAFPGVASSNFLLLKNPSRISRLMNGFSEMIRDHEIDYAHFQYALPLVRNCKCITTTHDLLFNDFPEAFGNWYRWSRNHLFRWSLQQSSIRLTVSDYSRKAIHRHYGIDPKTISITPNAVRSEFFETYDPALSRSYILNKYGISNYILCVSRIEVRKNHELILQAYTELQLAKKGIQLVFIGNDTFRHQALDEAIKQLDPQSQKNFHWHKSVDQSDLLHFYRAAEVFVYPSKAEGFGIPPLEAAACGINTLCSNATAMADFDFFGDQLLDPDDVSAFKAGLNNALFDPPSPAQLETVSQKIAAYYSWGHSAEVLHGEIQKVEGTEELESVYKEVEPC